MKQARAYLVCTSSVSRVSYFGDMARRAEVLASLSRTLSDKPIRLQVGDGALNIVIELGHTTSSLRKMEESQEEQFRTVR